MRLPVQAMGCLSPIALPLQERVYNPPPKQEIATGIGEGPV